MIKKEMDLSRFAELNKEPRTLLGPGPSMIHPRVYQALSAPVVGHLDPYFLKIMDDIQELLRYVYETSNQITIPISGTGSAAMEAAIANTVEPGDTVLICVNGYFGNRLVEMAKRYGGDVHVIYKPWGQIFSAAEVSEALKERPSKVVAIVHAETSTGTLQPIDEISKIVHAQDGIFIVDAVTSLGGVPVSVDENEIDVCYSGSQKCLSSPPGIGPITLSPRAEERLRTRKTAVRSWYLDLSMVQKYWGKERTYHHTAPISADFGFYESLRMVAEEGLENRWRRHRQNAKYLWDGLTDLGLQLFVDPAYRLPTLTTVCVPDGVDEKVVRQRLLQEYQIEIAGGLGDLSGKIWRVGLMGYSSRKENVLLLLAALKEVLGR